MLRQNSKGILVSILLLQLQGFSLPAMPDGGGRREITPYQPNSPITVVTVGKQKSIGDGSMILTFAGGRCANVGIAYTRNNQIRGKVSHSLVGTTDNGERMSIDFSVIEKMSILRTTESPTATKALFKVSAMPLITPLQLVNTRPTYSELVEKYRKTYEIWVETKNNLGTLSLTSSSAPGITRHDLCGKVESISTGSEMSFAYGDLTLKNGHWMGGGKGLWWAIPSVTGDTKYPYRRPAMTA